MSRPAGSKNGVRNGKEWPRTVHVDNACADLVSGIAKANRETISDVANRLIRMGIEVGDEKYGFKFETPILVYGRIACSFDVQLGQWKLSQAGTGKAIGCFDTRSDACRAYRMLASFAAAK